MLQPRRREIQVLTLGKIKCCRKIKPPTGWSGSLCRNLRGW
jgi:hypothetical protein